MTESTGFIRPFRWRMLVVLSLRYGVMYLTVGGLLWGLAVLVFRVTLRVDRILLLWPLVGLVPLAVAACIQGWRRLPSPSQIRALFDSHNHCGGLLMAGDEVDLQDWPTTIPNLTAPKIHLQSSRRWAYLAVVAVFVGLCFFAPSRPILAGGAGRMNIEHDVERIAKKIETLEELEILEQDATEELRDMLKNVQTEAEGNDPVKTFEALDHLENLTTKEAEKETESALGNIEKMSEAESLAGALDHGGDSMEETRLQEAMSELAKTLREAMEENQALCEALSSDLSEAVQSGEFTSEQLRELMDALKNCKSSRQCMIKQLCDAKLIDPDALRLCEALGQTCDPSELASLLCESGNCLSVCDALGLCQAPCKGGVSRGRGDAAMTWTHGSDPTGTKFKEIVLPTGPTGELDQSRIVGVSKDAPKVNDNRGASSAGALRGAAAGGGAAVTHTVLPRHRAAVKRYFQRDEK